MSNTERLRNAVTPVSVLVCLLFTGLIGYLSARSYEPGSGTGGSGIALGAVLAVVVGAIAGSRPLWDPNFVVGRRYGQRGWHLLRKYYGLIGVAATIGYNVLFWMAVDQFPPEGSLVGRVVAAAVIGAVLLLIPRTPFRQIGSGVLVGIVLLVYLVTSILCWHAAKRSDARSRQRRSLPSGGERASST